MINEAWCGKKEILNQYTLANVSGVLEAGNLAPNSYFFWYEYARFQDTWANDHKTFYKIQAPLDK